MCELCRLAKKQITKEAAPPRMAPTRTAPTRQAPTIRRSVLPSQQPARTAPSKPAPAPTRQTTKVPTRQAPTRTPTRTAPTRQAPTRQAPTRQAPTRKTPVPKGQGGGGGKGKRKGKPFPSNQCEDTLGALQDLFADGYTKVKWNLSPGSCTVCNSVQKDWTLEAFIEQTKVFKGKPAPLWGLTHPRCQCTINITSPDKDKPMVKLDWRGIEL